MPQSSQTGPPARLLKVHCVQANGGRDMLANSGGLLGGSTGRYSRWFYWVIPIPRCKVCDTTPYAPQTKTKQNKTVLGVVCNTIYISGQLHRPSPYGAIVRVGLNSPQIGSLSRPPLFLTSRPAFSPPTPPQPAPFVGVPCLARIRGGQHWESQLLGQPRRLAAGSSAANSSDRVWQPVGTPDGWGAGDEHRHNQGHNYLQLRRQEQCASIARICLRNDAPQPERRRPAETPTCTRCC